MRKYVFTHAYTYMYVNMYTYIYTHIHVCGAWRGYKIHWHTHVYLAYTCIQICVHVCVYTSYLDAVLVADSQLLHIHTNTFKYTILQPIWFGVSFLQSQNSIYYLVLDVSFATSVEKRSIRLRLENEIKWNSKCDRLYLDAALCAASARQYVRVYMYTFVYMFTICIRVQFYLDAALGAASDLPNVYTYVCTHIYMCIYNTQFYLDAALGAASDLLLLVLLLHLGRLATHLTGTCERTCWAKVCVRVCFTNYKRHRPIHESGYSVCVRTMCATTHKREICA